MTFVGRRILVVEDEFLVSLATTDFLESIGCEVVGPTARLAAAVQLSQSESLDAAVLDINIAGEMIWPVAAELQHRGVPFLFLSALTPLVIFPVLFASAPRLDKPLEQNRLLHHLSTIWGASCGEPISRVGSPVRPSDDPHSATHLEAKNLAAEKSPVFTDDWKPATEIPADVKLLDEIPDLLARRSV